MTELEELIKSSIGTDNVTATGFYQIKCPICETRNKKRAGFVFNEDSIAYNCFKGKCPVGTTKYVYGEYMPKKFREVLETLGIQIPFNLLLNNKKKIEYNEDLYTEHSYASLELPSTVKKYNPSVHTFYRDKLAERGLEDDDYYVGTQGEWKGKLIIPFRLRNKLIGWQGVSFGKNGTFYLKSSGNTDIVYSPVGYIPKRPIIVEGAFDAKMLPNCVAVLESTVTKRQAYILRNSNPILLPDRSGSRFMEVAKRYGWDISIPKWKEKDLNEALLKYGKFVVARMVHDGIQKNYFSAEVEYKLWTI